MPALRITPQGVARTAADARNLPRGDNRIDDGLPLSFSDEEPEGGAGAQPRIVSRRDDVAAGNQFVDAGDGLNGAVSERWRASAGGAGGWMSPRNNPPVWRGGCVFRQQHNTG